MRTWKHWTTVEIEKLRSMAGNRSLEQIAEALGRPVSAVSRRSPL